MMMNDSEYRVEQIGNAFTSGYRVYANSPLSGGKCSLDFDVFLDNALELKAVLSGVAGSQSLISENLDRAKNIIAEKLKADGHVFFVVENGQRHVKDLKSKWEHLKHSENQEEIKALRDSIFRRIDHVEWLIREARSWSHEPSMPFPQFMSEHKLSEADPVFDRSESFILDEDFNFHETLSPFEMVSRASVNGKYKTFYSTDPWLLSGLSPFSLDSHLEIPSPIQSFPKLREKMTNVYPFQVRKQEIDSLREALNQPDSVLITWTEFPHPDFVKSFTSFMERKQLNPLTMISTPLGCFSGKASNILQALTQTEKLKLSR